MGKPQGFQIVSRKNASYMFLKKKKSSPQIKLKLYEQTLEQVSVIQYLGLWMDSKLKCDSHIKEIIDKCKKRINVLRCLAGVDWGASRQSLKKKILCNDQTNNRLWMHSIQLSISIQVKENKCYSFASIKNKLWGIQNIPYFSNAGRNGRNAYIWMLGGYN